MKPEVNVPLGKHNTLGLASVAEYAVKVTTETELQAALTWARTRGLNITPLGDGSNVVLRQWIPGLVILLATSGIRLLSDDGIRVRLRVAAGENWHALVSWSSKQGFHGLENLALIPGQVGAAPIQNIGAYGVEVSRFVDGVRAYRKSNGECVSLNAKQCEFGYRDSLFKRGEGADFVIASVDFTLDRNGETEAEYPALAAELGNSPRTPATVFEAVKSIRRSKLPDPAITHNAGSFFKNPAVSWHDAEVMAMRWPNLPQYSTEDGAIKLSAGWMIDQLGWRGRACDGVRVSEDHALILINDSAEDVEPLLSLAASINEQVYEEFGLRLEIEPSVIGESSNANP